MKKGTIIASWIMQVIAAGILAQAAVFKLAGAEESRRIFEVLGAEPMGRLGLGVIEVLVAILLLVPRTARLGGLATVGLMVGAVASHLFKLGIAVDGDGGALFVLAIVTLVAGAGVVLLRPGCVLRPCVAAGS